jgi:hypothetical protein
VCVCVCVCVCLHLEYERIQKDKVASKLVNSLFFDCLTPVASGTAGGRGRGGGAHACATFDVGTPLLAPGHFSFVGTALDAIGN